MTELFTTITSVITNILTLMGSVGTALLDNVIFQLLMGILTLYVVMGIIFRLVAHVRKGR